MDFSNHLLLAVVFLVIGFVLLIKGADLFVEGSSSIAKKLNVPAMIIGLTIVAMGTSLPELAVSLTASMAGNNELAVSNVLGSNLFNLTVVIGVCALIVPVTVQKNTLQRDFPVSVISTILLFALGIGGMTIGHADGVILSALFVIFLILMVRSALKARKAALTEFSPEAAELELEEEEVSEDIRVIPVWRCILYIGLGIAGIILGSDWVVGAASAIAAQFGLSQNLIGLTIVAIGTSLPELVTSVTAARKNEVDLALGNALGSNIFNVFLILGVSGAISPMGYGTENMIDTIILLGASLLVWMFAASSRKIVRKEGIVMLLVYAADMVYICLR
ncbi:MAG: calcium/sodium antiporter [Lachnospiraceae bacterium]|jgi:cation:H+ antiporter|uniref:calcium/sodium antiporter n=1 Tax=Clostridium sp. (strain SY8519) TaxID=1042156 RepID=UPI0002171DF6|nr:calcium/sodium antiporter [Clostridium sp. SY8519]MCI1653969.1 calcium/sodium antiporter [Lachnospiraceae bacterium]MCI1656122.1 calcium/sodium antiporter [Lachnospiraceae bacterium]MCI2194604.1 calcium/sodium antiporter [Lachnospiraceae bacterium]BAK47168.1 Ca2+/Na+ antiporter [Clostridium sp. SY8519]HAD19822.1 sodium:calcium antiporter [Lachnospiraceae bacterium]